MERVKKSLLTLTALCGLNFGAGIAFGNINGFEQGFNQGINYQVCLAEAREKYNSIEGGDYMRDFEPLKNKCEEEYGLK